MQKYLLGCADWSDSNGDVETYEIIGIGLACELLHEEAAMEYGHLAGPTIPTTSLSILASKSAPSPQKISEIN